MGSPLKVTVRPDESVTIIGMKGSGKSQALLYLLKRVKPQRRHRVAILDTKQAGDFSAYPSTNTLHNLHKLAEKYPIFVYAPNDVEARDPEYHEGFFHWCYQRGKKYGNPTTCVVDELTSIVNGNNVPDSYRDITDRGRAHKVSIWQGNQKPVFLPHAVLSEADHYMVFNLMTKGDRDKMSEILGNKVKKRPEHRHGFWYYHRDFDDPIYVPGLKL